MGVPQFYINTNFVKGSQFWDLGVFVICKTPILKMIILHIEDVWGLFHASIDCSYNLFIFKFIVRMTQIMFKEIFF
jgi:hypothetical protein